MSSQIVKLAVRRMVTDVIREIQGKSKITIGGVVKPLNKLGDLGFELSLQARLILENSTTFRKIQALYSRKSDK